MHIIVISYFLTKMNRLVILCLIPFAAAYSCVFKQYTANCTSKLFIYNTTLLSPNFPQNYPRCTKCAWSIRTLPFHRIKIIFDSFELESHKDCAHDSVSITDYDEDSALPSKKFCGIKLPHPIVSSENSISIGFETDGWIEKQGFKAKISAVLCGGNFVQDSGNFTNPFYPDDYVGDKECIWTIRVTEGYLISLTFTMFQTLASSNCSHEYLEIRDGLTLQSDTLQSICANGAVKKLHTSSNEVLIRYVNEVPSPKLGVIVGFNKSTCGGEYDQNEGVIKCPKHISDDSTECRWTILIPEGHHVIISFDKFQIPHSQNCTEHFIAFYDGSDKLGTLIRKYCGSVLPPKQYFNQPSLTIRYFYRKRALHTISTFLLRYKRVPGCREVLQGYGVINVKFALKDLSTLQCRWSLTVAEDHPVVLTIKRLKLLSVSDYVIVSEMLGSQNYTIRRINGVSDLGEQRSIYSLSSSITITLSISRNSMRNESTGEVLFSAMLDTGNFTKYSMDEGKHQRISAYGAGKLFSHSAYGKQKYPSNMNNEVKLTSLQPARIRLQIYAFSVQHRYSWRYTDYLKYTDKTTSKSTEPMDSISLPKVLDSEGSAIELKFITDSYLESDGFALKFSEIY